MWKKAGSNVVVMVAVLGWSTSKLIFSFVHHWSSFLLRFLYFRISFPKLAIFFCELPNNACAKKKKWWKSYKQTATHPHRTPYWPPRTVTEPGKIKQKQCPGKVTATGSSKKASERTQS